MRTTSIKIALCLAVLAMAVAPSTAQDVRFKRKSKTELHVLGFLGGLFDGETQEEVSIKAGKMRADEKKTSTVTDLDGQRLINIDHKKKEYTIISFEEMAEMMKSFGARAEDMQAPEMGDENMDRPEYSVSFDLKVNDTGKSKKIDDHEAFQKVMVLETKFEPKDASADTLPSGSIYSVTDMWIAEDLPEMQPMLDFQKQMSEVMTENLSSMDLASVLDKLLESYPAIGAAIDRSKEEMAKVDGIPLVTTTHLITVPADMDLDLEMALGEKKKKKKGGGFGSMLKKMAATQGLGSGDDEDSPAEQKTIMSIHSSIDSISNKSRDDDYFDPPSKYKEVEYVAPVMEPEDK